MSGSSALPPRLSLPLNLKMVADTSILEGQAVQLARKNVATEESALAIKADLLRLKIRLEEAQAESWCDPHSGQETASGSLPLR
jgi:hypothetical protein